MSTHRRAGRGRRALAKRRAPAGAPGAGLGVATAFARRLQGGRQQAARFGRVSPRRPRPPARSRPTVVPRRQRPARARTSCRAVAARAGRARPSSPLPRVFWARGPPHREHTLQPVTFFDASKCLCSRAPTPQPDTPLSAPKARGRQLPPPRVRALQRLNPNARPPTQAGAASPAPPSRAGAPRPGAPHGRARLEPPPARTHAGGPRRLLSAAGSAAPEALFAVVLLARWQPPFPRPASLINCQRK